VRSIWVAHAVLKSIDLIFYCHYLVKELELLISAVSLHSEGIHFESLSRNRVFWQLIKYMNMYMESHGGMTLTGKSRRTRKNPIPVSWCQPQIAHGLTRARTRASAVRGRRLTAWAMHGPHDPVSQKAVVFILTAARTWNLTHFHAFFCNKTIGTLCALSHCCTLGALIV
jgi:hypothetical protein